MKTHALPSPADFVLGMSIAIATLFNIFAMVLLVAMDVQWTAPYFAAGAGLFFMLTGTRDLYLRRDRTPAPTHPISPKTRRLVPGHAVFDAWITRDGVVYFGGREPLIQVDAS